MSRAKMCSFSNLFLTSGARTQLRKAGWHLAAVLQLVYNKRWAWHDKGLQFVVSSSFVLVPPAPLHLLPT